MRLAADGLITDRPASSHRHPDSGAASARLDVRLAGVPGPGARPAGAGHAGAAPPQAREPGRA